jgi:hypothetical protein
VNGEWQAVRLIDNTHDLDRAHMHRYHGHDKQDAEPFAEGRPSETMPKAIDYIVESWEPIARSWREQ